MTEEQKFMGMMGLLKANVKTAREATMTGAFRKSRGALMQTYNNVYTELQKLGLIPEEFFNLADENSTLDDIGVLSRNLVGFLEASLGKGSDSDGVSFQDAFANFGEIFGESNSEVED
ncbi:MAG: hypothetical protein HN368_23505 [Spirochaetales bacterium]|nr:hypothetical protein [Spirochaetales bacterium]